MAHTLFRLREKTLNTPQLMSVQGFDAIAKYLDDRCSDDFQLKSEGDRSEFQTERYSFNADLGVATLSIDGPLSYRPVTMFGMDCGGTSYTQLKEDFTYLVENGARTIALTTDSPGGEAHGLFPTAQYMRDLANENGVKILAFVDGLSASAGYGLTSIADEIIVTPGSEVGSIGVVVRLMNDSQALKKDGYERSFVYAGSSKVPYSEDGSFRPDFIKDIQTKVDTLYTEFTEFVANQRNLSVDTVKSTEARTFLPKEAVELGLVDQVMTVESFYNYLAETAQKPQENTMLKTKLFKLNKDEETLEMSQEQLAQFEEMQTQMSVMQAALEDATSKYEAIASLVAEKETALAEAQALVAKLEEEKVEQKLQARKDKLAAVMAADKVEGVAASLASLDDTAFEVVLGSFSAQVEAVAKSDLFTEMGAQGVEAEATEQPAKTQTRSLDEVIQARLQNR